MINKGTIKYIHSLELKKNREKENAFVAEGPKTVGDIMEKLQPKMILATKEWFAARDITPNESFQMIDDEELRKISFLQHPQQVLGVFPIPQYDIPHDVSTRELCLALDQVQDPGNLGTIIRIADWFGISNIFCGNGTADAYNPKVVQATMGSIARVKLTYTNLCDMLDNLPTGVPVYGTSLDGENIYEQDLSSTGIIIMGNEGNGISQQVMSKVGNKLYIPCYQKTNSIDSLNVAIATAVTCAEFRRRSSINLPCGEALNIFK